MAYDPQCHELAEYFLADECMPAGDSKQLTADLAQTIQDTIEGWLAMARDGDKP